MMNKLNAMVLGLKVIQADGNSEGAKKGWANRRGGFHVRRREPEKRAQEKMRKEGADEQKIKDVFGAAYHDPSNDPHPKPFAWKSQDTAGGGYSVRLGFTDEHRGESFFDSRYGAMHGSGPGEVIIGPKIDYRGNFDWKSHESGVESSALQRALTPGTVLRLEPQWMHRRGVKEMPAIRVRINSVEPIDKTGQSKNLKVKYTQLR
jgi:hypothetical protein